MKSLLASIALLMAGCDQSDTQNNGAAVQAVPLSGEKMSEVDIGVPRFTIESHGKFRAGYDNNVRELLLITDRTTGKTYLGITGVGISELHSESNGTGKGATTVTRER